MYQPIQNQQTSFLKVKFLELKNRLGRISRLLGAVWSKFLSNNPAQKSEPNTKVDLCTKYVSIFSRNLTFRTKISTFGPVCQLEKEGRSKASFREKRGNCQQEMTSKVITYKSCGEPWTTASGQKCLFATLRYVAQLWLFQYCDISKFWLR